jgi:hypothetical protein
MTSVVQRVVTYAARRATPVAQRVTSIFQRMKLYLTEENSHMLMSSVCIVVLVLAGRGAKGEGVAAGEGLKIGHLTLGKRPQDGGSQPRTRSCHSK